MMCIDDEIETYKRIYGYMMQVYREGYDCIEICVL
jgi:hypothetical protein